MELAKLLRQLWRLRRLVAGVTIVAAATAFLLCYRVSLPFHVESRKYEVGVGAGRVLIDTPHSQVVAVAPRGSDTLGIQANLLASLMADGVVKDSIAQRAGLRPSQLDGTAQSVDAPLPTDPSAKPRGYQLTTSVVTSTDGSQLPIIEITTQAPDAAGAARLAGAAVTGLRDYVDSRAADEQVAGERRLRVTSLGVAQAREVTRGPRLLVGLAVALLLFSLGCGSILAVGAIARHWSAADEADAGGDLLIDLFAVESEEHGEDLSSQRTVRAHSA